jgi:hypothetical protein
MHECRVSQHLVQLALLVLPVMFAAPSALATEFADALAVISQSAVSKPQRLLVARFIGAECARYLQALPRLSPKENAWLDGEVAAGRDPQAVMRSAEFAKRALLNHFSWCTEGTNLVLNATGPDTEILGWATLISALDDLDTETYMRRSGSPQLAREAAKADALRLFAEPILDNVVIPHLRERAARERKQ